MGHLFCISSFKDFSVDFCPMPGNMQTVLQNTHPNVLLINSSACMHAQAFQSCLTLCSPMACSPPSSSVLSSQEYWSGWPCLPQRDLPNPRIKPVSPALAGGFFTTEPPRKPVEAIQLGNSKEGVCSQSYLSPKSLMQHLRFDYGVFLC